MRKWADVAILAKAKNLDGRLIVRSTRGLPFILEEGDEVAFVPPQTDLPREGIVAAVRAIDHDSAEVLFDGIDGAAARGLVGCHCLILRDLIDESLFQEEPSLWEGWEVIDADKGVIGHVVGIEDNPAHDILEVDRQNGKTLLVPVVDEFIKEVDVEKGLIFVDLPLGLYEL